MRVSATACTLAVALVLGSLAGCSGERVASGGVASAKKYIEQRNRPAALITLKEALRSNPDAIDARFLLGKTLLEAAEPVQALVELRKVLELGHPEAEVIPEIVKGLTAIGKPDEAVKLYADKRFDDKAAMSELQIGLAAAYGGLGRWDEMRKLVDESLVNKPTNNAAATVKATFLAQEGKTDEAWAMLESVLARDPGFAQALYFKGLILRHIRKDTAGAIAAHREALRSEPTLASVHSELLSIYYASKDKKAMRAQIEQMQRAMPKSMITALFKAQVEFADNNLKAARELVQQLLRSKEPDYRVLMLAAEIEYRSGALTVAETHLTRALNAQPRMDTARATLAQIQVRLGQTDKALRTLQPLLETAAPPVAALAVAAEAYLHAGNPAKAQSYFERAVKLNPDDPRLQTAVALNRMARGQVAEGLADLQRVAEANQETFADLALISTLLRRGRLDDALQAIVRLEKKEPEAPLPAYLRGQTLLAKGDATGARAGFLRSIRNDPLYFPAARALGSMDLAANDLPAAKVHFESMLAKDRGNYRALLAMADLKLRGREPRDQALALLTEAVRRNPTELEARVALAGFHLNNREFKPALSVAQDALASAPDHPALLDALGRAQYGNKEYQQAIGTYRRLAIQLPKSPLPHLRLADVHAARDERSAAVASLQRALEIAPDMVEAQTRQIEFLVQDKRHKEALAIARRVQQLRPKEAIGFSLESLVHVDAGAWDAAAAALKTSLSRQPTTLAAMRLHGVLLSQSKAAEAAKFAEQWLAQYDKDLVFMFHLGSVATRAKEWARAEEAYRRVLAVDANHTTSNNNLAWALMYQKKPGALAYAKKANEAAPGIPGIMDTLAAAMADAGQPKDALELQRKVVALAPNLLDARLNLARIAIQAGDKALARSELEKLAYEGVKFANQAEASELLRTLN